ncbi:hypothetical protein ACU635_59765 [[Actinomadura] parvosata]|uniref:hypothetical protein n=1 Tax=[Actinomadura] parvosata TaxID=1955412 RepID=UPI00406CA2C5
MTPLERTLARALTEMVIKLDHSDNDDITPAATIKVLEPVVTLLQGLSKQDRQDLADLINQFAQEETDPDLHLTAWEAPETLALLD